MKRLVKKVGSIELMHGLLINFLNSTKEKGVKI